MSRDIHAFFKETLFSEESEKFLMKNQNTRVKYFLMKNVSYFSKVKKGLCNCYFICVPLLLRYMLKKDQKSRKAFLMIFGSDSEQSSYPESFAK